MTEKSDGDRTRALLFGSEELTDEEERLRAELLEWMQAKLNAGCRAVAIQAALVICADVASGSIDAGIIRPKLGPLYFSRGGVKP